MLAINAADDERNPPETGLMEAALKQVKNGRLFLIPASEDTRGHGTTGMAKFYRQPLGELQQGGDQPRRARSDHDMVIAQPRRQLPGPEAV